MAFKRWLCLLLATGLAPAAPGVEEKPAADLHGDPLPAGAVARMGTVRLRHGCLGMAFSPDGKTFATAGTDHLVRTWDVASGKELQQFKGHTSLVSAVVYSPDGKRIIAGGARSEERVWEAASGKLLHTFDGRPPPHAPAPGTMVISPDGQELTAVCYDRAVRVWNLADGKERRAWPHEGVPEDRV